METNIESLRDDPLRTAAPHCAPDEIELTLAQQTRRDQAFIEAKEWHADRIKKLTVAVLAGHLLSCPGLIGYPIKTIQIVDAADLWEVITQDVDQKELAKLLVSPLDIDAKNESWVWADELIDAYVDEMAALLASEDAQRELQA